MKGAGLTALLQEFPIESRVKAARTIQRRISKREYKLVNMRTKMI
jgi:hypothetical protein